ncbi:hypothetical protein ATANTOWER_024100 [Ataeniobius toweri]|uniref:Uncharacterized protein n=1 Tax=Ataeniobius toweri TaxID=208326 RepID=A0ABU7AJ00_9TELE|nr:hypothetical protein [Ataeniobius toweri]
MSGKPANLHQLFPLPWPPELLFSWRTAQKGPDKQLYNMMEQTGCKLILKTDSPRSSQQFTSHTVTMYGKSSKERRGRPVDTGGTAFVFDARSKGDAEHMLVTFRRYLCRKRLL